MAGRTARFLKADMRRAGVTYSELARRLKEHGLKETQASISSKLARGRFTATFVLAIVAALEMKGINLADL